jgi:hypothetical protein
MKEINRQGASTRPVYNGYSKRTGRFTGTKKDNGISVGL